MATVRSAITMTDQEIEAFVRDRRTAILATIGRDGQPHLTAMWFALVDGRIVFETKSKSQKAVNVRRNPRVTVLLEDGLTYPELRGVSFEGTVEVIENADASRAYLRAVARGVLDRYTASARNTGSPGTPDTAGSPGSTDDAALDQVMYKRVALVLHPDRVRSWDHRKLRLDPTTPLSPPPPKRGPHA
ncbi:MAG: pyridoxamine 5'-phosphate oxidase family protein [Streptosporangiaceae bacterium]